MPSVAMKGGIFILAMRVPETEPQSGAGQRWRARMPTGSGRPQIGQEHAGDDRAEGHQRADRQVDAAGDDDERGGDGEHAVDGGRLQDADEIVGLQEVLRGDAEDDHQGDQAGEGQELLPAPLTEDGGPDDRPGFAVLRSVRHAVDPSIAALGASAVSAVAAASPAA